MQLTEVRSKDCLVGASGHRQTCPSAPDSDWPGPGEPRSGPPVSAPWPALWPSCPSSGALILPWGSTRVQMTIHSSQLSRPCAQVTGPRSPGQDEHTQQPLSPPLGRAASTKCSRIGTQGFTPARTASLCAGHLPEISPGPGTGFTALVTLTLTCRLVRPGISPEPPLHYILH